MSAGSHSWNAKNTTESKICNGNDERTDLEEKAGLGTEEDVGLAVNEVSGGMSVILGGAESRKRFRDEEKLLSILVWDIAKFSLRII